MPVLLLSVRYQWRCSENLRKTSFKIRRRKSHFFTTVTLLKVWVWPPENANHWIGIEQIWARTLTKYCHGYFVIFSQFWSLLDCSSISFPFSYCVNDFLCHFDCHNMSFKSLESVELFLISCVHFIFKDSIMHCVKKCEVIFGPSCLLAISSTCLSLLVPFFAHNGHF